MTKNKLTQKYETIEEMYEQSKHEIDKIDEGIENLEESKAEIVSRLVNKLQKDLPEREWYRISEYICKGLGKKDNGKDRITAQYIAKLLPKELKNQNKARYRKTEDEEELESESSPLETTLDISLKVFDEAISLYFKDRDKIKGFETTPRGRKIVSITPVY